MSTSWKDVQDAAYKFISYAASPEANATWFAGTCYLPINKKRTTLPVAKEALATQPDIDVAIESLPVAHGRERTTVRSDEHTPEHHSLVRNSYAVFCFIQKKKQKHT